MILIFFGKIWMNKNLKSFIMGSNSKKFNILKKRTEIDGKKYSLLNIHKEAIFAEKRVEDFLKMA